MLISKAFDDQYYARISKIESSDNPKAKAPTSSASGRFQFIRSTWEELGYDWNDVFNDKLQYEAVAKFTERNAAALHKAGCAINNATLYGSHFLGVAGFLKIMRALPSDPVSSVTSAGQRKANPSILKGTVKDFCDWLERKTGDKVTKRYDGEAPAQPAPIPTVVLPPAPVGKFPLWIIPLVVVVFAVVYFVFIKR